MVVGFLVADGAVGQTSTLSCVTPLHQILSSEWHKDVPRPRDLLYGLLSKDHGATSSERIQTEFCEAAMIVHPSPRSKGRHRLNLSERLASSETVRPAALPMVDDKATIGEPARFITTTASAGCPARSRWRAPSSRGCRLRHRWAPSTCASK